MNFTSEFSHEMSHLIDASLLKIDHCLGQLNDEQIWWRPGEGQNSIGNLLLHMCGNLRQWAIVPLTDGEDQRDRAAEFQRPTMKLAELKERLGLDFDY